MAGAHLDLDYAELRRGARRPGVVGAVQHYLRTLADYVRSPTSALEEIGETLVSSTKQRFSTQTDPSGKRWAPNRPATIASYLRRHGGGAGSKKILTDGGHLADSIHYQLSGGGFTLGSLRFGGNKSVSIGTNRVYGAMQQFGGTKARFPHLWGDIPARPYLGMSAQDQVRVNAVMRQYLGRL